MPRIVRHGMVIAALALAPGSRGSAQDVAGSLPISLTGGYAVFWTDPIDVGSRPGSAFFLRGFYRVTPRWQIGFVAQEWGRRLLLVPELPPTDVRVYQEESNAAAYLGALQLRPRGLDNLALRAGGGIARVEQLVATRAGFDPVVVSLVSNPAVLYAGASYDFRLLPRVYLTTTADLTRLLHSANIEPFRSGLFAGLGVTVR
ncbi:MAG TPA: hypothetical protein VFS33_09175 [Gemmatimonadales bacterium]|nr:hypothetical protein [Gemmatimonadales bacterium]